MKEQNIHDIYTEHTGKDPFYSASLDIVETQDYINWLEERAFAMCRINGKAKMDDTAAFGCPHHNHNKHRVYISGLSHKEAIELMDAINNLIK